MTTDARGFAIAAANPEAGAAAAAAVETFVTWKAAVIPDLKAALAADPDCAFAHILLGLILHYARDARLAPKIANAIAAASAGIGDATRREQSYFEALTLARRGELTHSAAVFETILADHPTDLLAQRMVQSELFWLGELGWSAEISGRAAPYWSESIPGYAAHLSCRAFDLEETHAYAEAERLGRRAVEIDPTEVWGAHAVAHVLTMQGRAADGIAWLDGLKDNWGEANQMALHLWWHRCLFHYERGEYDAILAIHDAHLRNRAHPLLRAMPDLYIDMQNGASILLRLELMGVDVGHRWDELAELALPRLDDHSNPLTSAHFAAILAAAGRFAEAGRLIDSMRAFAAKDAGTLGPRTAAAAIPAAVAAIAHRKGNHAGAIEALLPARRTLWQMGGSAAQRDLFTLLLIDSARKADRADILGLALADTAAAGFADAPHKAGCAA